MAWYNFLSQRGERLIKWVFYQLGLRIYHKPCHFLLGGFLITALCSIGFINFYFETNGLYLFVPRDSQQWKNYQQTIDYFGEFEQYAFVIIEEIDNNNLLTPDGLDTIYEIYKFITNYTNKYENIEYTFSDVCLRYYESYPNCVSEEEGLLSLWQFNPNYWSTQEFIQTQIDAYPSAIEYFVGNLQYTNNNDTTQVTGGSVVRLQLEVKGSTLSDKHTIYEEWEYGWEEYMDNNKNRFKTDKNIKMYFFTTVSFYGEFVRLVFVDAPVLVVAFVVMLLYLSLTFGKLNCVETRFLLAMSSLLATICALIIGMGLGCAFGWDINTIVLLIPFILLGVGVDDGIIIVETLEHTPIPDSDEEEDDDDDEDNDNNHNKDKQLAIAMEHSGMSISLTSFSSVVAFTVGAITSTLPGIIAFCGYAALCFAANFGLVVFFFFLSFEKMCCMKVVYLIFCDLLLCL